MGSRDVDPEVARWRADTAGCEGVVHFNNAGAALPPRGVVDAVVDHLRLEERIGGYEAAEAAADDLAAVRPGIATLVNADPSEIALVENATRAWDMAFYSIPFAAGDRIVTGVAEYASNYLAFLHMRAERGIEIVVCPDDDSGQLDVDALARLCDSPVRLIALTWVPTNSGLVNPAAEVGRIARERGILYLLDACQAVGQLPIDVDALGCDLLSATGRKYLRGPRGTGFLYADRETTRALHPPFVDLHAATWDATDHYVLADGARRFENWESYVAGHIGLGVATRYATTIGVDVIERRVTQLAGRLRDALSELPGVTLRDKGARRSGIVTFTHEHLPAAHVQAELRRRGINTSVSPKTYSRLDFEARRLDAVVRASVHYYNTADEIDQMTTVLREIVDR